MTNTSFELYATTSMSLEELRNATESALGVEFGLHDSSFYGGTYFRGTGSGDEELLIVRNRDFEGEVIYEGCPVDAALLRIECTKRGRELRERLKKVAGLTFIRSTVM